MTHKLITILCYWNGHIARDRHGLHYEGASPKPVRISNRAKYSELRDKIYEVTGLSRLSYEIKIICRYPTNLQEYIALPVEDDDTVNIIFDVIKHPGMNCIELYLEVIPITTDKQANIPSSNSGGHFTQLLTQETSVLDYEFRSSDAFGSSDALQMLDNEFGQRRTNKTIHQTSSAATDDDLLNVLNSTIEEIVSREKDAFVMNDIEANNNLRDEDENDAQEEICYVEAASEDTEVEEHMVYKETFDIEYEEAKLTSNVVVDMSMPGQILIPNDDGELYAGQRFGTKEELQSAVKSYSIRVHQQYVVTNSAPNFWVLKCKQAPQCSWRLRASIPQGASFFEIKKYNGPHTCVSPIINRGHAQLDSSFIANQIEALVKAQISITLTAIQAEISDKFNYDISKKKAWQAKQKAIVKLFGDWLESYKLLPKFMNVLERENPGTVVHWDKEPSEANPNKEIFRRVFWAFGGSIEGFKHCRPIISIDGTHLYGKYKGTMLIAVSCDANNQLFPLAFAIVEGENNDSWGWFMACIRHFVTDRNGLCVISDRHAGILNAMGTIGLGWTEPQAYHRLCIRHLSSNFNSRFHDKTLKNLLWLAANENQVRKFDKRMDTIGRINPEARKWLEEIPFQKWALAHDGGHRYGIMTTNLSEIFNSVSKGARCLPVTALVQLTFYRVNSYFAIRRQLGLQRASDGQSFTPFVDGKISSHGIKAGGHEIVLFNRAEGTFSIKTGRSVANRSKGGHVQVVKLKENLCSCQKWQIFGFPCSHVMAACKYCSLDYKVFVQKWYLMSAYQMTWDPIFHPIPDPAYWPRTRRMTLLPSVSMKRTQKGRPKSTRLRNEMDIREGRASITCSRCRKQGHNRQTCPQK